MLLPPIAELTLLGVVDRNVPNQERIVLRPTEATNLAQFGLLIALRLENGSTIPLRDSFFWFGETVVSPPSWIVVFTGTGQAEELEIPETKQKVHVLYWGRAQTVFSYPLLVPILVRIDRVLVGGLGDINPQKQLEPK